MWHLGEVEMKSTCVVRASKTGEKSGFAGGAELVESAGDSRHARGKMCRRYKNNAGIEMPLVT